MDQQRESAEQPLPEDIREQLQRMLAQAPFNRSPVLHRLLAYLAESSLDADARPPKEYSIGLDVFDRPDDFDPRVDTIVRVQAGRLRKALAEYYVHDGHGDSVLLEMPKGHYAICATRRRAGVDMAPEQAGEPPPQANTPFAVVPIPVPRTPLIGRDEELDRLSDLLDIDKVRLLSITGVGGTGKTRLALALADRLREVYSGGVLFLDLTPVTESAVLVDTLAGLFHVHPVHGQSLLARIAEHLRDKLTKPTLLVLDNFEGVNEGVEVLGDLLDASAMLSLLVTSRIPLNLYGEHEYSLPPLTVPSADWQQHAVDLATVPAVQLFLCRAKAANPQADFRNDAASLAELCTRLGGLPLAIELVAAQAGLLSPRQMLERFTGHLDLPENAARDAPARQRTLRRAIDWSHDLLDDDSRRLLRRLSVFVGGFSLEAVEAVADSSGDFGDKLLPSLNRLLALGLVQLHHDGNEPRYVMLETLRTYGLERLAASEERDAVCKAHAAFCLVLAEEGVGAMAPGQHEAWLAGCDKEQGNFRHALRHLLQSGPHRWALRLGYALFGYWEQRERINEGRRLLNAIIDSVPIKTDPALWARVTSYAATLAALEDDVAASEAGFLRSLEVFRKLGDQRGEALALNALGVHARLGGDESTARGLLLDALLICREIGDRCEIAATLSNLAECDLGRGCTEGVQELLDEAYALFVANNDFQSAAWCINHLGDLARAQGDLTAAGEYYGRAEAGFRRLKDPWGLARSLADRGQLAIDRDDLAEAGRLLLDALDGFASLNHQRGMATVVDSMACLAKACSQPTCVIKLLAAAESWRAALGYAGRRKDRRLAQRLREELRGDFDAATFSAMHDQGQHMSAADVASCIQNLIADIEP